MDIITEIPFLRFTMILKIVSIYTTKLTRDFIKKGLIWLVKKLCNLHSIVLTNVFYKHVYNSLCFVVQTVIKVYLINICNSDLFTEIKV